MKNDPLSLANAIETLGQLLPEGSGRDAVHVAVEPCIAVERLFPGQHIGIVPSGSTGTGTYVGTSPEPLGVVDPFLPGVVNPGQRFWMFLYPRTITGLRHEWTHPAFAAPSTPVISKDAATSEAWLRNWIKTADCPDYDTVMEAITTGDIGGSGDDEIYFRWEDYGDGPALFFGGLDAHASIPNEFWDHVEVVTGTAWPAARRGKYFSCSC